jgi:SAM-dependent methyltransferase
MFAQIKKLIPPNSLVLDVGCGTGRLSFQLSDYSEKVVGLDLSSKNISVANSNLRTSPKKNLLFVHGDIKKLRNDISDKFDFAVITYVIHEVDEEKRVELLNEIKKVADNIIIGDYLVPTPNSFWGRLNVIVEYLAGKEHYNNFKSYVKNDGINYLVKCAGLNIVKEIKNEPSTSHLVLVK